LQDVVAKVGVAQQPATLAEQHRAMPVEDGGEGFLVARLDEAVQQLPVVPLG